ncbi:MAG: helix-turn-helix domain-containing protein, partial [Corynebacterium variabile]|uniref:helix-turn-helix domain-containing protein n=1 Tax=Corynebacterium variabile TaxID=1727 RepID=UPI002648991C
MTVGAWRARLRVSQAAELLAGDSSVESAAHRVGLSSASALCHLVRRNTGLTPAQLGDRVREVSADPVQSAQTALPAQPTLHTWPRVNRFHVLLWAWRGRCNVTLGDTTT